MSLQQYVKENTKNAKHEMYKLLAKHFIGIVLIM